MLISLCRPVPLGVQATRRRYSSAALAGAAAVLMRQTNAVWAAFVLGEAVLDRIGMLLPQDTQIAQPAEADARGNSSKPAASAVERPLPQEQAHTSLISELVQALQRVWQQGPQLAASLWPLLLPPLAFVAFLVANGGSVVLGDKEAHTPVKHGAQLLYFGGWTAAMLWPQMASELLAAARAVRRRPVAALLVAGAAVAAAAGVAHVSTLAHPYLLADNRSALVACGRTAAWSFISLTLKRAVGMRHVHMYMYQSVHMYVRSLLNSPECMLAVHSKLCTLELLVNSRLPTVPMPAQRPFSICRSGTTRSTCGGGCWHARPP